MDVLELDTINPEGELDLVGTHDSIYYRGYFHRSVLDLVKSQVGVVSLLRSLNFGPRVLDVSRVFSCGVTGVSAKRDSESFSCGRLMLWSCRIMSVFRATFEESSSLVL